MSARWLLPLVALLLGACDPQPTRTERAAQADEASVVRGALSGDVDDGFQRVLEPRAFQFPADHGPHPDYRSEWWYFTGNLETAAGQRFGFQLTFFRFALTPSELRAATNRQPSAWRTRQVWMGHLALTDANAQRFYSFERFARGGAGLAGARSDRLHVWLEDWSAQARGSDTAFPLRLAAADGEVSIELELFALKPHVLQGDRGFSAKSDAPGNASYYYSYTRLAARGAVSVVGQSHEVTGLAWFDREWSTSALAADQTGWDWFALHLDDGRDLMFYRLRTRDGQTHPSSAGVLVSSRGAVTRLNANDITLRAGERWRSANGESGYPVVWQLEGAGLDLTVTAVMHAQAHRGRFRYWEGAVDVRGRAEGAPIAGRGYLEMTPYTRAAARSDGA